MGNIKLHTNVSNIANHTWNLDHKINFDDRHVIDKGNYCLQKTLLESRHTAKTIHTNNNSKLLPDYTPFHFTSKVTMMPLTTHAHLA